MRKIIESIGVKKILIGVVVLVAALVLFLNIGNKKDITLDITLDEEVAYKNTINISRTYIALRLKTDKLLREASTYPDYNTWNTEMTELLNNWENLETKAGLLEKQADFENVEKIGLGLVNISQAYTKDEISNVFDKAPTGKKIRTLAKYLGVDAKRAFKILKNDQDFVKADAWNEAGDTFKKLETSAVVIKDGCKVAGFVGAMAISGGAASVGGVGAGLTAGTATAGEAAILVVTGTDLMLEIGEDTATIALGDQHKTVKAISNIRSVTDPAASLLSLKDIPKNVSKLATKLDKIGVVLVQVDQVRSMVQDGKLLGINITPDSKKIEVAPLKEEEVKKWLDEHKEESESDNEDLADWLDNFEDLDDWMDEIENEDKAMAESEELTEDEELAEDEKTTETETEEMAEETNNQSDKIADEGKVYGKDGDAYLKIISPLENSLRSGQIQTWKAEVGESESMGDVMHQCYWTYIVDGEKKWEDLMSCHSTRGVPWPSGNLKVEVRVEFTKVRYEQIPGDYAPGEVVESERIVDIVDTISTEKDYEIISVPIDTHVYGQ